MPPDPLPARGYAWRGVDAHGRPQRGELAASSPLQAYAQLRQRGIAVARLQARLRPVAALAAAERATLYRQLGTLLGAGLPLLQALAGLPRSGRCDCCAALALELAAGSGLAQAMSRQPDSFPALDRALIAAAEAAGTLDVSLQRLASRLESELALRAKVRAALAYPLAVLFVAGAVLAFILLFVVPMFESMLQQDSIQLPLPTRLLLVLAHGLERSWVWLTALPAALLLARRSSWLKLGARLPLLGPLQRAGALALWCRTLAMLIDAGLPLLDALQQLDTTADALACVSRRLRQRVAAGSGLAAAMQHEPLLPALLHQLVETGEQSGCLQAMLERAGQVFEQQAERRQALLTSLVEPLLMLLLGGLCGGLMLAIYWPLLQLGQVLG